MYKVIHNKEYTIWYVINIQTKAIQSAWYTELDASTTCKDLNKLYLT